MPAINGTKLTIGNKTFSFNALVVNPDKYLPIMRPLFSTTTFTQKESESQEKYLRRLFGLLCRREGMTVNATPVQSRTTRTRNTQLSDEAIDIINAMGISIVKTNPCSLNVVFKNSGKKYRMKRNAIDGLINSVKKNATFERNTIKPIKIGVELEFVGNPAKLESFNKAMMKLVGENRYNPVMTYHKNNGSTWELGKDCSVRRRSPQPENFRGFELTSPIYTLGNKKDMNELKKVCNLVKDVFDGCTNASCGTHIHMSFPVESATDELCKHFARWYRKNEDTLFDKVVPRNRRENRARYSHAVNVNYIWDRYRKLNFQNVKKNSTNMHLEFRQLDGTLDYDKIMSWCKLQKLFVEMTVSNWNSSVNAGTNCIVPIEIEDVIVNKETDNVMSEELLCMSSMITAVA